MGAIAAGIGAIAGIGGAYMGYKNNQRAQDLAEDQFAWQKGMANQHGNSYYYDSNGDLVSSTTWDAGKGGYVSHTYESPEKRKDRLEREALRETYLGYLTKTPEEYKDFIAKNKQELSDYYTGKLDETFNKAGQNSAESMEARGMTGSRADVDMQSELAKEKGKATTEAATTVQQYADNQLAQLQNQWWNVVNYATNAESAADARMFRDQQVSGQLLDKSLADIYKKVQLGQSGYDALWKSLGMNQQYAGAMTGAGGNLAGIGAYYLYNKPGAEQGIGNLTEGSWGWQ